MTTTSLGWLSPFAGSVAVIVPCFNAARTLAATLESVLAEPDVAEIVAVDDGSQDATLDVARRFEPRVKVLTGPNKGVSAARNRGIAETCSEWLLFLDSDDLLVAGTVAQRLAAARESGADVVICDWSDFLDGENGASAGARRAIDWKTFTLDPQLAAATSVWATTAALLYRRSLVQAIGGFRGDLPVIQDARFLFDATRHGARFVHAPHVGAHYRVAAASLSRANPVRFWLDVLTNGRQIEDLWRAEGPLSAARRDALAGIFNTAGRGLFASAHPAYFDAVEHQRTLGVPLPRHTKVAAPLARFVGLRAARSLVSLVVPA